MELYDIAWNLSDLLEGVGTVYFHMDPDVPDFTHSNSPHIVIESSRKRLRFELSPQNISSVLGLFDATIFSKDCIPVLLTWNIKSFLTYARFFVRKFIPPSVSVVDLGVIESFLNITKPRPENYVEAVNRSKVISGFKTWKPIYKAIHLPLMFQVLPELETTPLINEETRKSHYSYYEIEGQLNGRMNSLKKYHDGYLPYTLTPDQKNLFKPIDYMRFFSADYRACEVYVLQWLSKDPELEKIISSGGGLHEGIYKAVTGDVCDTEKKRNLSKKMFLPVMYGAGVKGLAANLNISENASREILRRITSRFSVASEWMGERQRIAEGAGQAEDYFGRIRKIAQGEGYLGRNFAVQGVAATFCQEKLIQLHKALQTRVDAHLCFTIHDGYVGACTMESAREVYQLTKGILESGSDICPNLAVKVRVTFGSKLNQMQQVWTD